ncbi:LysM peptidoglycan-binding domain-containing protein [candidate division KSB1 bacterium]
MNIRGLVGLVLLTLLVFNCSKFATKINPPLIPPSSIEQESKAENKPQVIRDLQNQLQKKTTIIEKLELIDTEATRHREKGDLKSARHLYEEAVLIIFEFDEDKNKKITPEFVKIRSEIFKNLQLVQQEEGAIEINETAIDLLNDEGSILQEILSAERESEVIPKAAPPVNSTISAIPFVINSRVSQWMTRFVSGDMRVHFEKWVERSGRYLPMILEILDEEGMPRDLAYLAMIESGFNPTVSSYASAVGLWQFISATGKNNGLYIDSYIDERRNALKATRAAVKHLKDLYYYWDEDWYLALCSYNVSERRIRQAISRYNTRDFWKFGWPLPSQTRNYIPKFFAAAEIMKNPGKYGFVLPEMKPWTEEGEQVIITRQASLDVVAKAAGVPVQTIRNLNPELRIYLTPPISSKTKDFIIRVPEGTSEKFIKNFNALPDNKLVTQVTHTVRSGQTISQIAEMYRASQRQIMLANNITNARRIQIGQRLLIPFPKSFTPVRTTSSVSNVQINTTPQVPNDASNRQKTTYIVKKDDVLYNIAQSFDVSVNDLRAWNGLGRGYIYPDQKLTVWLPAGSDFVISEKVTPRVEVSNTSTASSITHTVRRNETISSISGIYGKRINDVLMWNNLTSRDTIYPGNKIIIRLTAEEAKLLSEAENGSFVYIVKKGDSLYKIAKDFGTTVKAIMLFNKKTDASKIFPGEKLLIPSNNSIF